MGLRGTAWALSRPDFLLLRPIRAAVSPAPDERLTQIRKHLQRFERSPDELDSQRARIWPKPRLGFICTEVAIVHGRSPAAKASPLLRRLEIFSRFPESLPRKSHLNRQIL